VLGRSPAEIRALTPAETALMVESWNAAQAGDQVAAPSLDEYEELVSRYE
jgi:hypothetical protein